MKITFVRIISIPENPPIRKGTFSRLIRTSGMRVFCLILSLAAGRLAVPTQVFAQSTAEPKASAEASARKDKLRQFDVQLQGEREEFRQRESAESKAFRDGLRGKSAEEKKAKMAGFKARQNEKRKAFREAQRAKRREFAESLPSRR